MNSQHEITDSISGTFIRAFLVFSLALLVAPSLLRGEDFDWRTYIAGSNFVSPVRNQDGSGMCSAFASTGALEAKYMLTRNDPTYVPDLSEQQLDCAGIVDWTNGGYIHTSLNYFIGTGLVRETEVPFGTGDTYWEPAANWQNRTCKINSYLDGGYTSADNIKSYLKQYGPLGMYCQVDNDFYGTGSGSYRGEHSILLIGFHDDISLPGGGYFIFKNSWGTGGGYSGYYRMLYSTVAYNRQIFAINSGAYFNGPLQTVTWDTSTSSDYQPGSGTWSTSSGNWSPDGTTLSSWRNGEDAAVFSGGGGAYTVNVDYNVSAHTVTFNSGASGYTLSGGTLTVTNGGITANENVTMNTGLTVGASQQWTIAAGKILTIAGNINTHISPLTVNCTGDMVVNGAIRDVHADSRWNGLMASSGGSLTKTGTGTLTLHGANTYTGDTTITGGTIRLGNTLPGLNEGRIDTYLNTTASNPAASIQSNPRMANLSSSTNLTYIYTGYINNPGGSNVNWIFGENYDDGVLLKIDGNQVLYNTVYNTQTTNSYTLTPGLHSFELRLAGGSTPNGPNGTGVSGTGLGVAYDTGDGNGFRALADPGDGSLFRLNNTAGGSMSPYSTVVMSASTTLDLNNYPTTVGALSGTSATSSVLIGSATLTTGGNGKSTSFAGIISGTGDLVKIGTGSQILTGNNTYEGGTTFNGGYLAVSALTKLSTGGFTFNGGGLRFMGSFDPTTRPLAINSGGAAFDSNNYTIQFYNPLTGSGGVTKAGPGTLYYRTANAYAGDTAVTGGTLRTNAIDVIPSGPGKGNVSVAYGANLDLYGYSQTINGLSGVGTVTNAAGSSAYTLSVGGNDATSTFDGKIQNTSGALVLNKIGGGTLTLRGINTYTGPTTIAAGTLKLDTPVTAAHRWSFNNSLADSVGGSNASIVDVGANNVTLNATQVTLAGGDRSASDYVSLGSNLLPNTNSPITIEMWATPKSIQNWSRIFDFGADTTENLLMSWTKDTTQSTDRVEWKDSVTNTSDNTNQPYNLNTEYHIVMTLSPLGDSTEVKWYSATVASANLGAARGTFTTTNTLANFNDNYDNLGRSSYSADFTANASYNEVRLWSGPITSNILEILHDAGPDANISSLNIGGLLPSATPVNITGSGAKLDLNNFSQTIGSLSGVAGSSVLLGSATLTVGGDNTSTTFSGVISGIGGVAKNGTGALTLNGANTYTGSTNIIQGQLIIDGGDLADASTVNVASGASLQVISGSPILGNVTGLGSTYISGEGTVVTISSINQFNVSIGAGAELVMAPLPGGPFSAADLKTVPEPQTFFMFLIALAAAVIVRKSRR